MDTIRIGVIGTGHMGRNHVRNLISEPGFDLVGIYDADMEQAKEVSREYGTTAYDAMERLFEAIEAVIVAVPSSLHRDIAMKAAGYSLHTLVEKPLALTAEDAVTLVRTFSDAHLKLAVGHIERFNSVFRALRGLVAPEEIFHIETCRLSPFSGSGRITDANVVEDLMIHDVDLVCALLNDRKPTAVDAAGECVRSSRTDCATCLMDFGGKAHAVLSASRVAQRRERRITVHTADRCLCADLLTRTLDIYPGNDPQNASPQRIPLQHMEALKAELVAFHDLITDDSAEIADGTIGLDAIRICEEIMKRINLNHAQTMQKSSTRDSI